MWKPLVSILIVAATVTAMGLAPLTPAGGQDAAGIRVGVYDSRAIAIAYASSKYFSLEDQMKEYNKAKQAGDEVRVKELEEYGQKVQRQLHRQGFGRVPVTELFEHIADRLPELAKELDIDVIAFECNYRASDVAEVDITLDLAALFEPTEQALKWARDVMKNDPIDLDELADMGEDH